MKIKYDLVADILKSYFIFFFLCSISTIIMIYNFGNYLSNSILFLFFIFLIFNKKLLDKTNIFLTNYKFYKNDIVKLEEYFGFKSNNLCLNLISGFSISFVLFFIYFSSIYIYLINNNYIKDSFLNSLYFAPFSMVSGLFIFYGFKKVVEKD